MDKGRWVLLAVGFAGALAAYAFTSLGLGMSLLIFFVGWPVVGTLVTIDDDLRDGWSNPDGSVRPPWLQMPFWGQIVAGLSLAVRRRRDRRWLEHARGHAILASCGRRILSVRAYD